MSQYLEQSKLDHQAEVIALNAEIKDLRKEQASKVLDIAQLMRSDTLNEEDSKPNLKIKERVIEKVVEKVVEDTSKIKRLK